jgi:hypothetical protein
LGLKQSRALVRNGSWTQQAVGHRKRPTFRPIATAEIERNQPMNISAKSGASLAAIAATMLLVGAVTAPAIGAEDAKGHCVGANACKGKGACKSASNACKGQNGCKGKGFMETTAEECEKIKGTKFEDPKKS